MIGKSISHYQIEAKLGEGGMGEVYQATDTKLRRSVALKVLPVAFADDDERMARFRQEAHLLASLNHPHIAQVFGLEEEDGVHAIVLELVEGPTLGERIQTGNVAIEESVKIAQQIAQALEFAHEQGVIHRDLKPENVKLTSDGKVKVLDFGLAKAIEGSPSGVGGDASNSYSPTLSPGITGNMTAANVILGTAGYMSPEQARGHVVDKRADIWAFGVVLYEMLVGRRLFTGDTVSDRLAAVLRLDPDWEALPTETPAKVKRLLKRCLDRDESQRLRDIGDARIALSEVMSGEVEDEPVVAMADAPAGVPKSRLAAIIAGTAIVAVSIGFAIAAMLQPEPPELPLLKVTLPLDDLNTSLGDGGTTVAMSPNGRYVAYTSHDLLWVRDLQELTSHSLPGTEDAAAVFWSPDNEWIGYGNREQLMKVRRVGGTPVALCELNDGFSPASGGAWRSDGRIFFTDGGGPLMSVSAQGGDPDTVVALVPDQDADFHNAFMLPNDRGVLFVVHKDGGDFDRIDVFADGQRKMVLEMIGNELEFPSWSPSGHIVFSRGNSNPGVWAAPFSLETLELTGEPFLAYPEAALPSASQNGNLVMTPQLRAGGNNQLAWVDRNGKILNTPGREQDQDAFYSLSPDGDRAALRVRGEESDLWIVDLVRETQTRFTFSDDHREAWPVWSSNGKLVFYTDTEDFPDSKLSVMRGDGAGEPIALGDGSFPHASQDGRTLIFSRHMGSFVWDLYYFELGEDGMPLGEALPFLVTDTVVWAPQLSPDSRFAAYGSTETDRNEIYLKPFPEGAGKWQVSTTGGYWPRWKADGTELYYANGADVMVVSVELEPRVRLGRPEVLFTRPKEMHSLPLGWDDGFAVTPDGERFLIAIPPADAGNAEEEAEPALVVIQNWYAEFETETK